VGVSYGDWTMMRPSTISVIRIPKMLRSPSGESSGFIDARVKFSPYVSRGGALQKFRYAEWVEGWRIGLARLVFPGNYVQDLTSCRSAN